MPRRQVSRPTSPPPATPAARSRAVPAGGAHRTQTRSLSASSFFGPIPVTRPRSSTLANGPLASRSATIFAAVDGPTPGSVSRSAASAVLMSTGPEDGAAGDPPIAEPACPSAGGAPPDFAYSSFVGTTICSPSWTCRARLTASEAALPRSPPAASRAATTREPGCSSYTPGLRTAPTTWTHTAAAAVASAAPDVSAALESATAAEDGSPSHAAVRRRERRLFSRPPPPRSPRDEQRAYDDGGKHNGVGHVLESRSASQRSKPTPPLIGHEEPLRHKRRRRGRRQIGFAFRRTIRPTTWTAGLATVLPGGFPLASLSGDDHAHELARHDDDLLDVLALDVGGDRGRAQPR